MYRFEENEVVIPLVVLTELEAKRHHPELGWAARTALRLLEQLRKSAGALHHPIPVTPEGGTLRIELNHTDAPNLPSALVGDSNDHRILTVARSLADEGQQVVLVTKDLPMRLKAALADLEAQEYRSELALEPEWPGVVTVDVASGDIDALYRDDQLDLGLDHPCHTGVVLSAGTQSALARLGPDGVLRPIPGELNLFGVRGRSAEQRIALDLLADPTIGIVSLGGRAGTGKSVLALAAALEAVVERRSHRRIVVYRPLFAVGGQQLGYLPGDANEKMTPWSGAVLDALDAICSPEVSDDILRRDLLEVLPLTHIRGRTLTDSFVIIDEAQNLERTVLLTALSRIGEGSRVVLTHDVAQRDNLRVGRHDGIISVIEALRDQPLFAHVTLSRSERSPVAAMVTDLLERSDLLGEPIRDRVGASNSSASPWA